VFCFVLEPLLLYFAFRCSDLWPALFFLCLIYFLISGLCTWFNFTWEPLLLHFYRYLFSLLFHAFNVFRPPGSCLYKVCPSPIVFWFRKSCCSIQFVIWGLCASCFTFFRPLSFYFSSSGFLTPLGSRTVFCLLCFLLGWLPDALNVRNGWAHSLLSPLFYLWLPVDSGVRQKLSKSWIVSAHRAWTPITLPPAWPCQPSYPRAPWCSSFISEWRSDEQVG